MGQAVLAHRCAVSVNNIESHSLVNSPSILLILSRETQILMEISLYHPKSLKISLSDKGRTRFRLQERKQH